MNKNIDSTISENNNNFNYDSSNTSKNDIEYILFLFPIETRTIKKLVDELLDRLEFLGSPIYNEYPDKNNLLRLIEQIYTAPTFPSNNINNPANETTTITPTLRNLTETIFFYEMLNRRRRYFNITNSTESDISIPN